MKDINKIFIVMTAIFAIVIMPSSPYAQNTTPEMPPVPGPPDMSKQQQAKTPVEKVSPGIFRIGDIRLNKKNRRITFPATVNMDKGLLEYLIVHSGGKTYESLFRTKVAPYNLQLAFLLLGFEGTDHPLTFQGAPGKPKGEPLEIIIEYKNSNGKTVKINPEMWMVKIIDNIKKNVEKLDWVFTGSVIMDGRFLAQMEGSIAAVYHDPVAIIDNASQGGESDEIWFVNEGIVPPAGTPVTITIKAKKQSLIVSYMKEVK